MPATTLRSLLVLALLAGLATAQASLLVPQQFGTIQSAIDAAIPGDTVLVSPGTYHETLEMTFLGVSLVSTDGPAVTIVDPQGADVALRVTGVTDYSVVVQGFTFQNGQAELFPSTTSSSIPEAGGINLSNSAITLRDCVVRNCNGGTGTTLFGGAVGLPGGAGALNALASFPRIYDCDFIENTGGLGALVFGGPGIPANPGAGGIGGICVTPSLAQTPNHSFEMKRCRVIGNVGGGGALLGGLGGMDINSGPFVMENVLIAGNCGGTSLSPTSPQRASGGALLQTSVQASVRYVTVTNNSAGPASPTAVSTVDGLTLTGAIDLDHAIVRDNPGAGAPFAANPLSSAVPTVSYCNIEGGSSGVGNVDLPAGFVDPAMDDYHLASSSPMRDIGSSTFGPITESDLAGGPRWVGIEPDLGCFEFDNLNGSGEDFQLRTFVTGNGNADFPSKPVMGGDLLTVRFGTDEGTFLGAVPALFVQVFATGMPPASPFGFPELEINGQGNFVVLFDGNAFGPAILSAQPYSFLYGLPTAFGLTARLQAVAFSVNAANGIFAASRAHDLIFP